MRTYVRSEILLTQGEIALTRSEIWLRHVKSARRRVSEISIKQEAPAVIAGCT